MNKSERLNDMLIYLNDKKTFNLRDIMDKYTISKSTALRDLQSLETMGMPIYSVSGRNGHYRILENRLLSPILFNIDEVKALYFSMQTLEGYQSTPFHVNVTKLKNKFEGCISHRRLEELDRMRMVFRLGEYTNQSLCEYLDDILYRAIHEHVCTIRYRKGDTFGVYTLQFYEITSAYGQWYAKAYNFERNKPQVLRCDKINQIKKSEAYDSMPLMDLKSVAEKQFRDKDAIEFEVEITRDGVDLFHKEHYPSMALSCKNKRYYIKGYYNKREEHFISTYWIPFGETILSIRPESLKEKIIERLEEIKGRIKCL